MLPELPRTNIAQQNRPIGCFFFKNVIKERKLHQNFIEPGFYAKNQYSQNRKKIKASDVNISDNSYTTDYFSLALGVGDFYKAEI